MEALSPEGDGVATTAELLGNAVVRGLIGLGGPEHKSGTEGEGLRSGGSPLQGLQLLELLGGRSDGDGKGEGHGEPPCAEWESGRQRSA
jgi:hypothetical protein